MTPIFLSSSIFEGIFLYLCSQSFCALSRSRLMGLGALISEGTLISEGFTLEGMLRCLGRVCCFLKEIRTGFRGWTSSLVRSVSVRQNSELSS